MDDLSLEWLLLLLPSFGFEEEEEDPSLCLEEDDEDDPSLCLLELEEELPSLCLELELWEECLEELELPSLCLLELDSRCLEEEEEEPSLCLEEEEEEEELWCLPSLERSLCSELALCLLDEVGVLNLSSLSLRWLDIPLCEEWLELLAFCILAFRSVAVDTDSEQSATASFSLKTATSGRREKQQI